MTSKTCCKYLLGLLLLSGCGKQIPEDIIQPSQMESILYDYHLADGMAQNQSNIERVSYRNYVFRKHGITEAEFDSSMVWYTRKSKELAEIYKNLSERYKKEEAHIQSLIGDQGHENDISASGDSVNIWRNQSLYWLTDTPLNNLLRFEIKSDSNFYPKDAFSWSAHYTFLSKGTATMALNLVFDNDSVIGKTKEITRSGTYKLDLHTDSAYQLRNIHGFIYLHADSTQTPSLLINDLSLMRYHTTDEDPSTKEAPQLMLRNDKQEEIVR